MLILLAWLGGVLFVISLSWCAFFYVVVLRTPAPIDTPLAPAVIIDVALFSTFALHHSLLARSGVKRVLARHLPAGADRTAYVWVASILLLLVCWLWQPLPGVAYVVEAPWHWALYAAQIAGVVLTWRGAAVVDVLDLAGVRQARHDTRTADFRIIGPFRFVRHPIYLGWILMVFGAPAMTTSRLLFASLSSLYLVLAIPWEERALVETFGDRYRAYQASVRWRLLPGVW